MNQMGLSPSASCECGATDQPAQHIASECPLHRCKGDMAVLDTAARNWLHDLQCDVQEQSFDQTQDEESLGEHCIRVAYVYVECISKILRLASK